jgi:hypothetical protein
MSVKMIIITCSIIWSLNLSVEACSGYSHQLSFTGGELWHATAVTINSSRCDMLEILIWGPYNGELSMDLLRPEVIISGDIIPKKVDASIGEIKLHDSSELYVKFEVPIPSDSIERLVFFKLYKKMRREEMEETLIGYTSGRLFVNMYKNVG